jgi:hypothetical protein
MRRDTGIGLGLLAFCGLIYWQAGLVPAPPFVPIGPAFYPRTVSVILGGFALWLIAEDLLKRRAPPKKTSGPAPAYGRVAGGFAVFVGYVASLSILGYVTATFCFVLAMSWIAGPRRREELPKLIAVAAATTLVTYLVFEK